MKRFQTVQLTVVLCLLITCMPVFAEKRIHSGCGAGFGLPKIPLSRYRSPVSITAGLFINYRILNRLAVQTDGGILTTFSLGTVDQTDSPLRYDQWWTSLSCLYRLRGAVRNESFVAAGGGLYHLSQQFDNDEDALYTAGMNLGIVNWHRTGWGRSYLDVRWHLLFQPSPNPQVLTLTFGIML